MLTILAAMRKKGLKKTRTLTSAMPMQAWVNDEPVETGYMRLMNEISFELRVEFIKFL